MNFFLQLSWKSSRCELRICAFSDFAFGFHNQLIFSGVAQKDESLLSRKHSHMKQMRERVACLRFNGSDKERRLLV
ncbi:hypothetical protein L1887_38299 [Cichorium endivia]|nr:hypothetical protein L1887_38299 [Cichorium endivia]